MEFNKEYLLQENNFFQEKERIIHQIVLGNTGRNTVTEEGKVDMSFINSHIERRNKTIKTVPTFSIDVFGRIYQHLEFEQYSHFTGFRVDKNIISISLHNEGYLLMDSYIGKHTNWEHKIFKRKQPIHNKEWRGKYYFAPYTTPQYDSLNELIEFLCTKLNIEKKYIEHNTLVNGIEKFEGITSRSNYANYFLDVSPAFSWEKLI